MPTGEALYVSMSGLRVEPDRDFGWPARVLAARGYPLASPADALATPAAALREQGLGPAADIVEAGVTRVRT
jgi:hypothetical protein